MVAVCKVRNMPPTDDSTIHVALSVEDEEDLADHRSVAEADPSVEVRSSAAIGERGIRNACVAGRGGGFDGGFDPSFGQPFENYGPPPMVGRPPFARPPRGFGGPMLRGTTVSMVHRCLSSDASSPSSGRGRPPMRGAFGYEGDLGGTHHCSTDAQHIPTRFVQAVDHVSFVAEVVRMADLVEVVQ